MELYDFGVRGSSFSGDLSVFGVFIYKSLERHGVRESIMLLYFLRVREFNYLSSATDWAVLEKIANHLPGPLFGPLPHTESSILRCWVQKSQEIRNHENVRFGLVQ